MLLKRLEIQGFKSFPDHTVFRFHQDGLTAVVGPNGCGKSNIVDAVRWALGEQSAKLLRGQTMEDVIFNGSDRRKPAGMAEVTLTFDNDGTMENQWRDYSEISVSRKLFRTGESEYLINGIPCRLKDVRELIADAGGSSRGYSIVEQGRVSLMINSRPEEKRALIDEAAGILKYRLRRLEAERKLDRTRNNLLRVGDVIREVQRQLNSLKRSAAKARRYRALRDELADLDLRVRFDEFSTQGDLLTDLEAKRQRFQDDLSGLESRLAKVETREESLKNELAEGEEGITGGYEEVRSMEAEIARLEGDISVREEAIRSLEDRVTRLSEDEKELKIEAESDLSALKQLELDLAGIEEEHDEHLSRLKDLETAFASSEADLARTREEMETGKNALFTLGTERSRLEMVREADTRSRVSLQTRQEEAGRRRESLLGGLAEVEGSVDRSRREFSEACADSSRAASDLGDLRNAIQSAREAMGDSENRLAVLSERQAEARGLLRTLRALEEQMEGLPDGARRILNDYRPTTGTGVLGVVADYVEVPREFERAVTAVLGERLGHVIVDNPESGRSAVEFLRKKEAGRGSFIPRTPRANGRGSLDGVGGRGIIGPLSGLVQFSGELNGLGEFLLGGTLLVKDLEVALNLWKKNGFTATMVTLDGDILDPSGIISGGVQNVEESPLARKRKIRELGSVCSDLERAVVKEKEVRDRIRADTRRREARLESLEDQARDAERKRIGSENRVTVAEEELRKMRDSLEDLDSEFRLMAIEDAELAASLERGSEKIRELEEREEATRQTLARLEESSRSLEARLGERRISLEQSRIRVSTVQLRRENSHQALAAARHRSHDFEQRIVKIHAEIADAGSQVERHRLEIERGREAVRGAVVALEERRNALNDLRGRRDILRQEGEALSRDARDLRAALVELRDRAAEVDIKIHELRAERQHIVERVFEEHGRDVREVTINDFDAGAFDREEAAARTAAIRERITRLGEVNPGAVDEFEELNERFTFLTGQKRDLEESIESLQKAIRAINRTSRDRFLKTFREVNENFSRLFPRLITGGAAEMVLLDENDPLNTGVDIHVRLPGKRVKSMQLLSGGEKAMVSLTMILSMFLAKPSPVCILDEVDAPLDDENLGNFAALIREMSDRFQFLVITHNKLTMEAVDVLYGITMREPGASQVVSVRLREVA